MRVAMRAVDLGDRRVGQLGDRRVVALDDVVDLALVDAIVGTVAVGHRVRHLDDADLRVRHHGTVVGASAAEIVKAVGVARAGLEARDVHSVR